MAVRRSTRVRPPIDYTERNSFYPDGPPETEFELMMDSLNREKLPTECYAAVDDIIVYSLFGAKRRSRSYRSWTSTGTSAISRNITAEEGIGITKMCHSQINQDNPTRESCRRAAVNLQQLYGHLFDEEEVGIIEHLLLRYFVLYSNQSPVRLEKTSFHDGIICAGLRASTPIPAASVVLSTCGSMSSDLIDTGGFSVIQSAPNQLGPRGPRVILGPFRFANHDCKPNCQIMPIQRSYACVLVTLRDIDIGESITVKYSSSGYHDANRHCGCASCNPLSPPKAPRRAIDPSKFQQNDGKKKKNRRGHRNRKSKLKQDLEHATAAVGV